MDLEAKMMVAYERYLSIPLATKSNYTTNELYVNRWFVQTMMVFDPPRGHRHFTLIEFVYQCGKDEVFKNRFCNQE